MTTIGLLRRAVRPVFAARTWLVSGYLLLSMVVGTFWFVVLVTGVSVGIPTAIIYVGLLVLAALPFAWRAGARLERRIVSSVFDRPIRARYRQAPNETWSRRARLLVTDPAIWKDLAYLLLLFPLGVAWSIVVAYAWGTSLSLVAAPFYYRFLPAQRIDWLALDHVSVVVDTWWKAALACLVGLALTVPAAWIVRGAGEVHFRIARFLLGSTPAQELAAETIRLRDSRDRLVEAAAAERRRIERDLHDGVQQRLIALAMDLGMAKEKVAADPAAAQALVEQAHAEAKRAIADLRDIARGLRPAILADLGLDAALSALAGRSPVPVEICVALPQRPPATVESTVYFVVAEALANVAKHAGAQQVSVIIGTDAGGAVRVTISDDGVGGASIVDGGGLSGLVSRVEAVGGTLRVSSPTGGPTIIDAEVP